MSTIIKDWDNILSQYKTSNLSQRDFCKKNELPWNQFRYRWERQHLAKKREEKPLALENHSVMAAFEPVVLNTSTCDDQEGSNITEVAIYLPNQIRCDAKVNFQSTTFTTFLKQLVTLC